MQQLRQVEIHVRTLASRRTRALVVSDERRGIALGVNFADKAASSSCASGRDYSWQRCWQDYRLYAPQGLIQAVCAAMQTMRPERGDQMFTTMAERHGRQMLDLGTLHLLNKG